MTCLFRDIVCLDGTMRRAVRKDVAVENGLISNLWPAGKATGHFSETYDAGGLKALIPGLVNGHTHAAMVLLRGLGEETPLKEWLEKRIWPVEARLTPEHVYWGTRSAILEMASTGATCFADMYFEMDEVARACGDAGMNAGLCRGIVGGDGAKLEQGVSLFERWSGKDGLTIQIGPHAPYTVDPDDMKTIAATARDIGAGLHLHFLETEWERAYITDTLGYSSIESYMDDMGFGEVPYMVLAHCVWFPENEMPRIAGGEYTVAHNPSSNLKLGSGIAPVHAMQTAGVKLSLGTDGAASNNRLDVWEEMRTAALLHKGQLGDPTVVRATDVLKMATLGGAESLGFAKTGCIREGWKANLAVVDLDRPHYCGFN
ncbi:MAG: amidohydrolase, partial [Synergistota bacterium]|nr:amidohydrolase [Synergistota bacterium]